MEIQGKIILALPQRSGTSARGDWKAQDFVVETLDGQFSRKMVFTVFGEERLQRFNIQVGQDVSVSFDIDAREYQGRWFNSIRAYDVRPVVNQPANAAPYGMQQPAGGAPFAPQQPVAQAPFPQQPAAQAPFPQQPAQSQMPPAAQPAPQNDAFDGGSNDDLPF